MRQKCQPELKKITGNNGNPEVVQPEVEQDAAQFKLVSIIYQWFNEIKFIDVVEFNWSFRNFNQFDQSEMRKWNPEVEEVEHDKNKEGERVILQQRSCDMNFINIWPLAPPLVVVAVVVVVVVGYIKELLMNWRCHRGWCETSTAILNGRYRGTILVLEKSWNNPESRDTILYSDPWILRESCNLKYSSKDPAGILQKSCIVKRILHKSWILKELYNFKESSEILPKSFQNPQKILKKFWKILN